MAMPRHTGQEEREAISHLLGRLWVLLHRGNVANGHWPCRPTGFQFEPIVCVFEIMHNALSLTIDM